MVRRAPPLVGRTFLELVFKSIPCPSAGPTEKSTKRKASALELIPRHQKLVELVGKRGSKTEKDLIRRKEKLTVTDVRQQLANRRDHTEENVQKLLMFSATRMDEETRKKIIKRARTGRYVTRVNMSKKGKKKASSADDDNLGGDAEPDEDAPAETVFTEEDFANFAKELEKSGLL
uniref:Active regulator of SIRT1 n=1 Tax=Anopheles atroparvus TaxID=41427 RepID=A0AAG5DH56_ANOAO